MPELTPEEVKAKVAGKEKVCPSCDGRSYMYGDNLGSCPTCHGTGREPRFLKLREKCPGTIQIRREEKGHWMKGVWHPVEPRNACKCHGLGYTISEEAWNLLACAYEWRFEKHEQEIVAYCRLSPDSLDHSASGPTHEEAAWRALLEACGRE